MGTTWLPLSLSTATSWPALVRQEPSVLSVCPKCLCVHHPGICPQVLGSMVPEFSKLPGCLNDIFLGGKVMVSCCTV